MASEMFIWGHVWGTWVAEIGDCREREASVELSQRVE